MTETTCTISEDTLAAYAAGDLAPEQASSLALHIASCPHCANRLTRLRSLDQALKAYARQPLPHTTGRRTLDTLRDELQSTREIMTLDEVASFLRLTPAQADEVLCDLPAFELAGQIRVRRSQLIEWIQQQERLYQRNIMRTATLQSLRSALAKGMAS